MNDQNSWTTSMLFVLIQKSVLMIKFLKKDSLRPLSCRLILSSANICIVWQSTAVNGTVYKTVNRRSNKFSYCWTGERSYP